jgi:subtilisin family serine protease
VHFWTSTVAQGIDYAREIKADVVSMSMGGLPSAAWADAVNAAYEAGVVIVCAVGNNFGGLPTSLIVYPAGDRRGKRTRLRG